MIPRLVVRFHRHGDRYPVTVVAYGIRETQRVEDETIPELEADDKVLFVEVHR